MHTFAALNHATQKVTGLIVVASHSQAESQFGLMPPREIRELPDDPKGWSLKTATQFFFPKPQA